ncbi:MAG: nucleotide exchange factor GrpE [Tepidanaerobacteraceae bacterium]|nr:nucleotide exchange factor GrpE [Tepidanaerobacteraceae bacterium]
MTIKSGEDVNQCHQEEDNVFHEQNDTTNSEESKNEECLCKQEQVVDDNQKETDELQKIIEEKQKEIDEYKNRWLRVQADFDNYRKRVQRDIQEIHLYAGEQLIKDILPVIDNLERALDSMEEKDGSLYKGVELIYQQLKKVMEKYEIKEIEAMGKPFDPSYHDAVMMVESEEYQDNIISEVMLKGYMYHSKVIRPSMVKVVKNL